jgi:hypothetical protein
MAITMSDNDFVGRGLGVMDGQVGLLMDYVKKKDVEPDRADADVRAAAAFHAERERDRAMVDKYRASGLEAAESWDRRIEQRGEAAAFEAQSAYENAPRPSSPAPEPERNEDDYTRRARDAFKEVAGRQTPEDRARGMAVIDRFRSKYGGTGIVDRYADIHQQFVENPAAAAVRTAQEIRNSNAEYAANQKAQRTIDDYKRAHGFSREAQPIMRQLLLSGDADTLEAASGQADWLMAGDVEERVRAATSAWRQAQAKEAGGVGMLFAKEAVAEWDKAHPNVSNQTRGKMRWLLERGLARDLDDAHRQAKQR